MLVQRVDDCRVWHDAGMPSGRSSARFVGRDRELSRIALALEAAVDGQSRRLVVSGPGGIGVSRLIDESVRRIGRLAQPFTVLRWRAHAGRTLDPYAPVVDGLRTFLGALDDEERARTFGQATDALSRLVPEFSDQRAAGPTLKVGPDRRAAWLAEAVMGVLERAAERQPVLLVLEDLHLADAATRPQRGTRPTGTYPPNEYGLYDVCGNVWEWVADWYSADYYGLGEARDPRGPHSGNLRLVRGGAWVNDDVSMLRCAYRHKVPPDTYAYSMGFRIVCGTS